MHCPDMAVDRFMVGELSACIEAEDLCGVKIYPVSLQKLCMWPELEVEDQPETQSFSVMELQKTIKL